MKINMTLSEIADHFNFEYKDKQYCVQRIVKIKGPLPGQWFDGILYRPYYDATQFYVRTYEDFISKFKPI